jgi:hypothetical protein
LQPIKLASARGRIITLKGRTISRKRHALSLAGEDQHRPLVFEIEDIFIGINLASYR